MALEHLCTHTEWAMPKQLVKLTVPNRLEIMAFTWLGLEENVIFFLMDKIPSVTAFHEFSVQTASLLYTNGFTAPRINNPDFKMACRYLILRHQRWHPGPIRANGKWKQRWKQDLVYPVFNNPPNSEFPKNPQLAVKIQITKAGVKRLVIEMVLKERAHLGQWYERGVLVTMKAWQDEAVENGKRRWWQFNLPGRRVPVGFTVISWDSSLWS